MSHTPDSLRAPTVDKSGRRRWLYPDRRPGRLSRIRGIIASILMAIYLIAPFVTIQCLPLIRFDVLQGIVYVFVLSYHTNIQKTSAFFICRISHQGHQSSVKFSLLFVIFSDRNFSGLFNATRIITLKPRKNSKKSVKKRIIVNGVNSKRHQRRSE